MGFDDICNTGLVLGLGSSFTCSIKPKKVQCLSFEPSLALGLGVNSIIDMNTGGYSSDHGQAGSNHSHSLSGVSNSFSSGGDAGGDGGNRAVKRERALSSEEIELEEKVISSRVGISDVEDEDGSTNARKKLRLTKDQSALLEESFKLHSTLNPRQKQALAIQLNLRLRQVEVWFQNRRARTKLKQTEVDYELLKKCCENLTDENRRLKKEVIELKALKLAQPSFLMHMPAATLTMCPSCEKIDHGPTPPPAKTTPFSMEPHHHLYINPFTNPSSAAC